MSAPIQLPNRNMFIINYLRKLDKGQEGFALLTAMILLRVGSFLIGSTAAYISMGIRYTTAQQDIMLDYYSVEAGFEEAYWELKDNDLQITEGTSYTLPTFMLNEKTVDVTITNLDDNRYRVTTVASGGSEVPTTIISDLLQLNFYNNAITSQGDINIQPDSVVDGDVVYGNNLDNQGTITQDSYQLSFPKWPTADELITEYSDDVDFIFDAYLDTMLDIVDHPNIGPLYRNGDLQIQSTGENLTCTLQGTVYITGNLDFKQPGTPKSYVIDLNGNTIFALGNITFPAQGVSVSGNGCIIAVGDLSFQPGVQSGSESYVFLMSVEGTVYFAPQNDFNGSVAGNVEINLQPGTTLTHYLNPYEMNLNFPIDDYDAWLSQTWSITRT